MVFNTQGGWRTPFRDGGLVGEASVRGRIGKGMKDNSCGVWHSRWVWQAPFRDVGPLGNNVNDGTTITIEQTSGCFIVLYYDNSNGKEAISILPNDSTARYTLFSSPNCINITMRNI